MKVQTSGMMSGLTVNFELADLTPSDQRELFMMCFRHLGFGAVMTEYAIKQIDDHLVSLALRAQKTLTRKSQHN